jgi:hypothetical protein
MINSYTVVTCTALGASKPKSGFASKAEAQEWAESHGDNIDSYSVYAQTTSLVGHARRDANEEGDCVFRQLG